MKTPLFEPVQVDPYEAFFLWCKANGFDDVADCEPEDVDLKRLDLAIAAYAAS